MVRLIVLISLLLPLTSLAQKGKKFTRQDSLRGSITAERAWWDIQYYDLKVQVFPEEERFEGSNLIRYQVIDEARSMQIDLQPPMQITKIEQAGKSLAFRREGNAYFVQLKEAQEMGSIQEVLVYFDGAPKKSKKPPWDGGVVWTKDAAGKTYVATACQGIGASIWWPCKDHYYDEPDSMSITARVPSDLMNISNGRLRNIEEHDDKTKSFTWFVSNPINNYGVNINVGDYSHFGEKFEGLNGTLDCDYYVLSYNLEKAKKHFKQVGPMLEAFEHWFGPYPFYEDSYKLVEVPYPGMEHQSSVTYGNGYTNGYYRRDISNTGWGYKFDFIIIHESGHEWFANSITQKDVADMWVHEGFTAYSESLYLDYLYGKKASSEYMIGTRMNIANDRPIIGHYEVNHEGSQDMYSKAANMLHTLRQMINDDEKWRSILLGINKDFYHSVVTSAQIEAYLAEKSGLELKGFFDQYLRDIKVPLLEYTITNKKLRYRFRRCNDDFKMPVRVFIGDETKMLEASKDWAVYESDYPIKLATFDENYYIELEDLSLRSGPQRKKKN